MGTMRVDERARAGGRGREDSTDYFFNPPQAYGVDGKCKWGGRCEWMGLMRVDEEMRGGGQEP